jgi:hypothetical protein
MYFFHDDIIWDTILTLDVDLTNNIVIRVFM